MPIPLFIETEHGRYLSVVPGTQYRIAQSHAPDPTSNSIVHYASIVAQLPQGNPVVPLFTCAWVVGPGKVEAEVAAGVKNQAKKFLDLLIAEMARPVDPAEIALKRDFSILRMDAFARANFDTLISQGEASFSRGGH